MPCMPPKGIVIHLFVHILGVNPCQKSCILHGGASNLKWSIMRMIMVMIVIKTMMMMIMTIIIIMYVLVCVIGSAYALQQYVDQTSYN